MMAENIYNLDDKQLVGRLWQNPPGPGKISCLFRALPSEQQKGWDLSQYGKVDYESNLLLRMRLRPHNVDLAHEVKQAWVSKYIPAGTHCMITLDPPVPGQECQVVIERFGPGATTQTPQGNWNTRGAIADAARSSQMAVSRGKFPRYVAQNRQAGQSIIQATSFTCVRNSHQETRRKDTK
ncbi:hypothetical protein F5X99DRAFT_387954 [Biscogniauxia marginata]|nr:hypothetical protein F5X99DRAFT_387954 [Biscogniauxia marginata]